MDPIYQHPKDGQWYFYDETWSDCLGPFPSEEDARRELEEYVEWLENG